MSDLERRADAWSTSLQIKAELSDELGAAIDREAQDLARRIVQDAQHLTEWVQRAELMPHEFTFHHPMLDRVVTLESEFVRLLAASRGPVQDAIVGAIAERLDVREAARRIVLGQEPGDLR